MIIKYSLFLLSLVTIVFIYKKSSTKILQFLGRECRSHYKANPDSESGGAGLHGFPTPAADRGKPIFLVRDQNMRFSE
jgi:hypothetical protein